MTSALLETQLGEKCPWRGSSARPCPAGSGHKDRDWGGKATRGDNHRFTPAPTTRSARQTGPKRCRRCAKGRRQSPTPLPWSALHRPGTPREKCPRSQRTSRAQRGNPTCDPATLWRLFRRVARTLRIARCRRRRRGRALAAFGLAGGIAEIAEEIGIGPQHQMRIRALHAALIGLHRAIEGEEARILAVSLGENAIALAVALAADLLGLGIRFRHQHGDIAVGPRPDLLGLLAALGAELGRFALALGLHALVHRLAILLRQVDAP